MALSWDLIISLIIAVVVMLIIFLILYLTIKSTPASVTCHNTPTTKVLGTNPLATTAPIGVEVKSAIAFSSLVAKYAATNRLPTAHFLAPLYINTTSNIFVHPYSLAINPLNLTMSYPVNGTIKNNLFTVDVSKTIALGSVEALKAPTLTYLDEFSATIVWSSQETDCRSITALLVAGSPYITLIYYNCSPKLTLSSGYTFGRINDQISMIKTSSGTDTLGYRLYAPGVTWQANGGIVTSTTPIIGMVRCTAVENPNQQLTVLDAHYTTYPTSTLLSYGDSANITITFKTNNSGPLLMLALPHQDSTYLTGVTNLSFSYNTLVHGPSRGVTGTVWTLNETPIAATFYDTKYNINNSEGFLPLLQAQWEADINLVNTTTYPSMEFSNLILTTSGIATLLLIGDQLNRSQSSEFGQVIIKLTTLINGIKLQYDVTWGGLLYQPNDTYASHLVVYGYLTYSIAVLGKYNATWLQQNAPWALSLLRDYINPSTADTYFPRYRHKDWYLGYSNLSGLGDQRNTASSMAGINGYYGAYLLSSVLGNPQGMLTASVLLATEIRSVRTYFQLNSEVNINTGVLPSLGQNWLNYWSDYGYGLNGNCPTSGTSTNISDLACYLMGNIIPLTSIAPAVYTFDWLNVAKAQLLSLSTAPDTDAGSKGYLYMLLSMIPGQANTQFPLATSLTSVYLGNTKTNILYFIARSFVTHG